MGPGSPVPTLESTDTAIHTATKRAPSPYKSSVSAVYTAPNVVLS
jgi:hypothetical protein